MSKGCYEVRGKTLGIVGYGHIGSQVGVLAEMLGMKVKFFDIASKVSTSFTSSSARILHLPEGFGPGRGACRITHIHDLVSKDCLVSYALSTRYPTLSRNR